MADKLTKNAVVTAMLTKTVLNKTTYKNNYIICISLLGSQFEKNGPYSYLKATAKWRSNVYRYLKKCDINKTNFAI